jgi:hypothetical protein
VTRATPSVVLYLSLVFFSGALVGTFGHRLYSAKTVVAEKEKQSRKPEDVRQRYLKEYETRLKLNSDQMQKLVVILDQSKTRFKATHDRMDPEMKQIMEDQRNAIRAMLLVDQKPEYEKMLEERERRRKQGGGPPR